MEVFPDIKKYKNIQEWWKESKKLLRKNISKAMETGSEKEVLKDMVRLLDRLKIRSKGDG